MLAGNPVNYSLAFLIAFLWTGIYPDTVECISFYHHHFKLKIRVETFHKIGCNIVEFVSQLTK